MMQGLDSSGGGAGVQGMGMGSPTMSDCGDSASTAAASNAMISCC